MSAAPTTSPEPEPAPAPPPPPQKKLSRAERRAREREAAKAAKRGKRAARQPPSAAEAATRREVARAAFSTSAEGADCIENPTDDVFSAEIVAFRAKCAEFHALRRPTLMQVADVDALMKSTQQTLEGEGAKAQQRWRIARASLSHATDPRHIAALSLKSEQAKQRVLKFNTDVRAFNTLRDQLYDSPAHREAMEYTKRAYVTNPDGSLTRRETLEEDEAGADFESLLYEMKEEESALAAGGDAAGGGASPERGGGSGGGPGGGAAAKPRSSSLTLPGGETVSQAEWGRRLAAAAAAREKAALGACAAGSFVS
jgi:hypothetical protein